MKKLLSLLKTGKKIKKTKKNKTGKEIKLEETGSIITELFFSSFFFRNYPPLLNGKVGRLEICSEAAIQRCS